MDNGNKHRHFFAEIERRRGNRKDFDHFFDKIERRRRYHREFHRMHKSIKYFRPAALLFNLIILFLLINLGGLKAIIIFIAIMLIAKEVAQIFFLLRLEKRIFKPIEELKNGVEEIARGNYQVEVKCNVRNEIGLLVDAFNHMARKLRESEKIKSEYEENRKELIASISHDLKTPITSIQGYIEAIVEGDGLPAKNKDKYLQIIYRNIVYVNKLIDDLFLFSKLDMQKLNFQFEKVSIRAFMKDLMEEFKYELEERQLQFTYADEMEQDLPVSIDRKRIHQAVRNIIGNALKYGPEEGLIIKTRLYKQEDYICIAVDDNGPGISEDKLPYIFNRFYRIDNERTKDLLSTGLGLAIARELVEAHGGTITVSSREGLGTCFNITLPAGLNGEGVYE
ncbi:histidine kinase [Desulfocucumis palustris]|uniref:histidine kinase n=1 Tax=Desulfocucumis palustris TaxID=1898651 RepID=A0A2L2XF30_9FIRM|nr:HAMP domain-containing sensor histidine kinase [Desulfocucumis palustris]GBF34760.1 histidine kinase [Desulfocucumis palustris]